MDADQLPIGFLMAMAQNAAATARFGRLSEEQKQQVVNQARQASSRREMQEVVRQLGQNGTNQG